MADAYLYKSMPNLQRNTPFPIDFKSTCADESMASAAPNAEPSLAPPAATAFISEMLPPVRAALGFAARY